MASQKQKRNSPWGGAFWLSVLAVSLILSLGSYHSDDPSFSTFSSTWHTPRNVLGYLGSWTADIGFQVFGFGAWLWPLLLVAAVARWLLRDEREGPVLGARWWIGLTLLMFAWVLFFDLTGFGNSDVAPFPVQGLLGITLAAVVRPFFGPVGSYIVVLAFAWSFCMAWWESLPAHFANILMKATNVVLGWLPEKFQFSRFKLPQIKFGKDRSEQVQAENNTDNEELEDDEEEATSRPALSATTRDPVIRRAEPETERVRPKRAPREESADPTEWELPPLSLLENVKRKARRLTVDELQEISRKISSALRSFEIEGHITEIVDGPIITMYEFQPAPGVRVQKLLSASTDLAMALGVASVRIVAPIPGKSVAGIEVPNPDKEEILLRDVFESTIEKSKAMKVPLTLGKDSEGKPVVEDLSRMPHLLIGGATSMGKSVLVNSILTGLLCRFTPEELKLIIVDPKLVEFKAFEDIPHLMLPLVHEASDASQALKWAVGETKRRYLLMQKLGAKNVEAYNQKVPTLKDEDFKEGEKRPTRFSYIVIIIDELAELMQTSKKDVEQSIVRLSQLARAAGIHLIMSTQRPSADVVTGLIKSNCPSRVALRVASATDSRIILDCAGAEQLLGKGDMFFTNTGPMGLRRMQGSYVSDPEIERICDFWRSQGEPEYKEEILAPDDELTAESVDSSESVDPLYKEVIDFAKEKGKISTSLIQRKFQIGYTRAARIMEQLEARGVVGEAAAAGKPRDVMI
ncbi:MAG: DNA translocase FtsK [Bdellovibrionales bacterium]|nr:DNA translocase FtsK [Bdellovibrionales bacterium]